MNGQNEKVKTDRLQNTNVTCWE